jgi:hypothetical protein
MNKTQIALAVMMATSTTLSATLSATTLAAPSKDVTTTLNDSRFSIDAPGIEVMTEGTILIASSEGPSTNSSRNNSESKTTASSTYSWSSGPQAFSFSSGDANVTVSTAIADAFAMASQPGNIGSRTIKNAPYSAEIINERTQTLPDGNQIVKRTSQLSFRDSAGRTRIESRNDAGEVTSVVISDSVEGNRLFLSPKGRVATKMNFDRDFQKRFEELRERAKTLATNAGQLREKIKSTSADGKTIVLEAAPGEEIIIKRTDGKRPDGKTEAREEVSVRVVRGDGGHTVTTNTRDGNRTLSFSTDDMVALAPLAPLGPLQASELMRASAVGTAFQDRAWSAKATTKELGTREIGGVRAEGKLRSYTIPAGEIGNKNAIVVSTETWTSPDLQMTVYSKHSDPRLGETVYRLANLKRGEQPLSLFSIPDGYKLRDLPAVPAPPLPPSPPSPPAPPSPPSAAVPPVPPVPARP